MLDPLKLLVTPSQSHLTIITGLRLHTIAWAIGVNLV